MKICHVTDCFPQMHATWGGAEQAAKRTIEMFSESSEINQMLVTTPSDKPAPPYVSHFALRGFEDILGARFRSLLYGIKVILIPFDPLIHFRFRKLLKNTNPDVVHLHNFKNLSCALVSAAQSLKIPIIYSVYDYWIYCPKDTFFTRQNLPCIKLNQRQCLSCYRPKDKNPSLFLKLPLLFRQLIITHFFCKVTAFSVLSESSKSILIRHGVAASKIAVIHQVFDFKESQGIQPAIVPDTILFVGWLSPNKGAHILLKAAAIVTKKYPEATFILAGDSLNKAYKEILTDIVNRENLSEKVNFLGKKKPEEIQDLLLTSEIVVIPEQWDNMSPLFLTESLALKKPVVASNIGGLSEFIINGTTGFYVNPLSPEEFADKICYFLENKDESKNMGELAHIDIRKKFDNHAIKAATTRLYKDAIS